MEAYARRELKKLLQDKRITQSFDIMCGIQVHNKNSFRMETVRGWKIIHMME